MVFKKFSVLQENRQASNEIKKNHTKTKWEFQKRYRNNKTEPEFLELKNTMTELKIQERFKCRLDQSEESIIQLEDRSLEITQSE